MFDVNICFQFPAWDERDGITYRNVNAMTKSEAIKAVRKMAYADGHVGFGGKGRATFKAERIA